MGSTFSVGWLVGCFLLAMSVRSRHFKFFKVSMAQETVEGALGGVTGGVWGWGGGGKGGQKWLFFTLHSDQSFLNTPELRGSRIGTHPAGRETTKQESEQQQTASCCLILSYIVMKVKKKKKRKRKNFGSRICYDTVSCGSLKTADYIFNISSNILSLSFTYDANVIA